MFKALLAEKVLVNCIFEDTIGLKWSFPAILIESEVILALFLEASSFPIELDLKLPCVCANLL